MSWPGGRKSEDVRAASSLANSQNGGGSQITASTSTGGGGGIFSFLKTELDSFVKGLSGKADCLQPADTPTKPTPIPPRKKLKRSHEPKQDQPTYAELKAYERELDEIRQHTSKRFTSQDYYAPLTEANLHASTSKLQDLGPSSSTSITRDRRSQETRELVEAYSSYYTDEPVPQVPSPYAKRHDPASESIEKRRRKRERAATFINDEEAKQAVARQIAEEEARLKAAEARAVEHRRTREREARDNKRRQDRAEALARLEAQQLQQDANNMRRAAEREHHIQSERDQIALEERRAQEEADQRRRAAREQRRQQQLEAEAQRQREAASKEDEEKQARSAEAVRLRQEEQQREEKAREEQAYRLRRQQRENARRTRDLENAEKERTQAIKDASESKRIRELEAEVQRLRNELEEAKRKQEEAAALSASVSRHVHFAPTPPASDGQRGEMSFLSMNSASSTSLHSLSRAPPPPAPPPPPPPMASTSTSSSTKSAKPSPLALLAAHRASVKSSEGTSKKRPSGINAAVGMPADMGKFLSEMKNTKLRKVGMPVEGAKKPRDDEETGLKSILEGVLKKRFLGDKDCISGSTRTSSIPTLSNNSQTSISTADESITSFSSYRPPDWSMEMDSSPFPPVRSTSLRRPQSTASASRQAPSAVYQVNAAVSATTTTTASASILPRTLSQPQLAQSQSQRDSTTSSLARSQSLARIHPRPNATFGHAITSEEPAPPTRQRTQVYVSGHHRQSSQSTPLQRPASESTKHRSDTIDVNEPSTSATMRTRQSSDQTMTGRSIRSVGSSFDIELYTQMQLQEENDSLEEEMRRSFSNPPPVDGSMDFASPPARQFPVEASSSGERLKIRSPYQIPTLTFRQPDFTFSPGPRLPAARPNIEGGRKVSYYTHPRAAPEAPLADIKGKDTDKRMSWSDASGRPLSPSKSRAKLRASRVPVQSMSMQALEDDESILLPYLTEEQADVLLTENDNSITGYGTRTN